jgi:peptidylprolyl isomerase
MKSLFIVKPILILVLIQLSFMTNAQTTNSHTLVKISTEYGDMTVKLYNETPLHRDNFIKLVEQGFYNDLIFHRVINKFMIQGGDPQSKNAPKGKQLGSGDVGYTIPAEFVYPQYFHKKGALAAARQGDQTNPKKASSGCQFYIVQGTTVSDAELQQMEQQAKHKAKQTRFYALADQHKETIKQLRISKDTAGLEKLQAALIAQVDADMATQSFTLPETLKNEYKTLGGTPFLDNEYTVFGEVIDNLELIDTIGSVKTMPGDRPATDIKMTLTILQKGEY